MEVFYHGTCRLFDSFDPTRLGSGEGKSKFGHGIYITSSYETAALYASKAAKKNGVDTVYVYTVGVPELTECNYILSSLPLNPNVAIALEKALGEEIPNEAKEQGKLFRKYVGNVLIGNRVTTKEMMDKAGAAAEDAVSGFLNDNGITYLVWPKAQMKPDVLISKIHEVGLDAIETNRAVLNAECIKILKIEQVKTDEKNKLIKGSETLIKEF